MMEGLAALTRDDYDEPSVFRPEGLLREVRRQRQIAPGVVPSICVLDPDGDMVRHLVTHGRAVRSSTWACYHTDLYETNPGPFPLGIVGCAVGAPFAVLVAEQLFASGCELLISVSSAGQIAPGLTLPCFILIERARRGDGTSHCYLPPSEFIDADPEVIGHAAQGVEKAGLKLVRGATWTTDAPFRETRTAVAQAAAAGVLAVEMEAAALYAFGRARRRPVICVAHVTNQMAQSTGDFEKGPADGVHEALAVVVAVAAGWPQAE